MRRSLVVVVLAASACAAPAHTAGPEIATGPAAPPSEVPAAPVAVAPAQPMPPAWTLPKLAKGATLLGNLGDVHRNVTTKSAEAQAFFDQGLALTYGFNHDEAARSYAQAAELDPSCAMCFWGAAYTLGPNYNVPMLPDRAQAAWEAVIAAEEAAQTAGPVEKALIAALKTRYKGPEYVDPVAMQTYNEAYAKAMRDVARSFPDDLDVQTLFAEAMMNRNPWKLWTPDGKPEPGTEEIVSTLEGVIKKNPSHVGANHLYIHAVEASKSPGRALGSADRLGALVPAAGHLVHMPAHIYQRVGRYSDASLANRQALAADQSYLERVKPPGYYPFYINHNYGFLAYSASMQGRRAEALSASRNSAKAMPSDVVCGMPGMDFFLSEPLLVMVRFGLWDDITGEPRPAEKYQTLTALWHHAQGMARAAKGELTAAGEHMHAIRNIAAALPKEQLAGLNTGRDVLELAAKVVEARMADSEHRTDAVALWEQAVAMEDKLAYSEPSDWFYPVRHYLGAALLDTGKAREAEAVYRADLEHNPHNGWALYGLYRSLDAQKKKAAAKKAEQEFRGAWKDADVTLTRTAY